MPELPEVELVTRQLDHHLRGRTIQRARLLLRRLAPDTTPTQFARLLHNSRIESITRRGKHILLLLSNERVLIVHLRMTGRFLFVSAGSRKPKHTHAEFFLDDRRRLLFIDQRQFGFMKIVRAEELYQSKELCKLAPEPFSEEFSPKYLYETLQRSNRALKELLLDQTRVTGLGNIYAAEALFRSRINPHRRASSLSRKRIPLLHNSIREVLSEAIDRIAAMRIDIENIDGSYFTGTNDERWRVYDREGKPCFNCNAPIRRISQSGRSTFYCPNCQRG